jgi:UDP-glucose 4-epimerase
VLLRMKVLVTGGAGFIGSHVVGACLAAGHEVVVVDNLSSGSLRNVPEGARFVLMDIGCAEFGTLVGLERPDIVDHHAAQISVTASARDPVQDARINALGLLNVLGACVRNSVKKFIFISTGGAIYGDTDQRPTPESFPPQPLSPYGIHKLLGEHYLRFFSHQEDGMTRDYVYVEDVARANVQALNRGSGEIFNIGTGAETTTGTLYRAIAGHFPKAPESRRGEARPGDLRHSALAVGKAKSVLGWQSSVALHEGLGKTVAYFS